MLASSVPEDVTQQVVSRTFPRIVPDAVKGVVVGRADKGVQALTKRFVPTRRPASVMAMRNAVFQPRADKYKPKLGSFEADLPFDIALGRSVELYNRVDRFTTYMGCVDLTGEHPSATDFFPCSSGFGTPFH